jgi:hypothetical protein
VVKFGACAAAAGFASAFQGVGGGIVIGASKKALARYLNSGRFNGHHSVVFSEQQSVLTF